jgi:coproporphyrinogen III oxidase
LRTSLKNPKSKRELFEFVAGLGNLFNELYQPFLDPTVNKTSYTKNERDFQLYRRGRYAEFNLVIDRGTKFGLQSEGRTESILMSLPTVAKWKYGWKPAPNSIEEKVVKYYLVPQDWVSFTKEEDLYQSKKEETKVQINN